MPNKYPQIAYRWDENPSTDEVGGYFSNDPFAWHWLSPYGNAPKRTLYMTDVRYKRKFPMDCGEKCYGGHSIPWRRGRLWYFHEFVVKHYLPAFKVGEDIERCIHLLEEYIELCYERKQYEVHPEGRYGPWSDIAWEEWQDFSDKLSKLWKKRVIALCEKRFMEARK